MRLLNRLFQVTVRQLLRYAVLIHQHHPAFPSQRRHLGQVVAAGDQRGVGKAPGQQRQPFFRQLRRQRHKRAPGMTDSQHRGHQIHVLPQQGQDKRVVFALFQNALTQGGDMFHQLLIGQLTLPLYHRQMLWKPGNDIFKLDRNSHEQPLQHSPDRRRYCLNSN
ncbi:hypothetical protein GCM10007171_26530 [Dickeya fangzhongdai]|nr:hypothetical protein GCM10007171_26530 [Dickeya fangzhongdai]